MTTKVQLIIDEKKGVGTPVLITPKQKSSIQAMAFYARIEEPIRRFSDEIRKTLSAYKEK